MPQGGWASQLVGIDTDTPVPPVIPVTMVRDPLQDEPGPRGVPALAHPRGARRLGSASILVPAVMALLGERNWWLLEWLCRALPRRGSKVPEPTPAT